jgi:Ca2+-binding EF-hand superfamily protein
MMDRDNESHLSLVEYDDGFDMFDLIKDGIITKIDLESLGKQLGGTINL